MSRAARCTCHLLPVTESPTYCPRCATLLQRAVGSAKGQAPERPAMLLTGGTRRTLWDTRVSGGGKPGSLPGPARGQQEVSTDRYRSDTERRYALLLQWRKAAGELVAWFYEPCKGLFLAPGTSYTPDFLLWFPDGHIEFHEVKGGFIREKDWIKVKVAAARYSFWTFRLAQWKGHQWHWKTVPAV